MAQLQYTFIFDMPGHGFTETHWRESSGGETLLQSFTIGQELGRRRQEMSGEETILQAVRIANGELEGRVGTSQYNSIPGKSGKGSAASNVAMNILIATTNNAQTKQTQFRGFWDDEEITGGAPLKSAAFMTAFNSWASYFVAQAFGWRGQSADTTFTVVGYTTAASGITSIQIEGDVSGSLPLNRPKSVRFSGINSGRSQLNGEQVVIFKGFAAGVSVVDTKFPIATTPFNQEGVLHVYSYTLRDADACSIQRVGKRQAGAPLLRSRGRGPKRLRV
jgi:hypothetical protein